jgi:iron complex outermembrane receptor protein
MKAKHFRSAAILALGLGPVLATAAHAQAQTQKTAAPAASAAPEIGEVIVTARKRQESLLNVPVVEAAIQQQTLVRMQTNDLKDVASMVPGLMLGDSVLSTGTQVSIRGVGTSALDPGVDAAVSLNIDGLQLSQGLAYGSAVFDVGQIEVLKGPQALFYGKSSPGGVISIRSADPTSQYEVIARAGYEFESHEKLGELILSGPLSDTVKVRLAGQYANQDGFYENVADATPALGAAQPQKRIDGGYTYLLRGTVLWNPTSNFDARLKLNQARDSYSYAGILQFGVCPEGVGPVPGIGIPFMSPNDDCKIDRSNALVDVSPQAFPGVINNGKPYQENTQTFGTLELNYHPRSDLTITSTTAYYLLHSRSLYNTQAADSGPFILVTNGFHRRELTEELRANSDFAGPFNFTAGAFFQRARFTNVITVAANQDLGIPLPPVLQKGSHDVGVDTNSVFGQLRYKVTPEVEIAAGARWTAENRDDIPYDLITGVPVPINLEIPKIHSSNISPELTITYKPQADLTFFGSLKQGYKSGSFNVATPAYEGQNNSFTDEKVQGGEVGMKSRLFDRRLSFNMAGYYYKYTGLQVGANTPTNSGIVETRTVNAGSSQVYGIEAQASYLPEQIEGLTLNAAINWNHARFTELDDVPCYGGQSIAAGCNEVYSAAANGGTGGFTAQNRSGVPLIRAPLWEANFGFNYQRDVGREMQVIVASSTQFSSKYLTNLGYIYYQPSFFKTDLSLTLQGPKDRWELAFIGKDLNNALTSGNCSNANNQAGLLGGQITGTNGPGGPAGIDETGCWMDRGRELWVRVTFKPLN